MPSSLKDIVGKNLDANDKSLKRGELKSKNQDYRETNFKMNLKKGLIYASVISTLFLSIYGVNSCWHKRQGYIAEQKTKHAYYQRQFDDVKFYYNRKDYFKADELSERLQEEMGKERLFSPTKDLYNEIKKYDNDYINPEVHRVNRERFYHDLKTIPRRITSNLDEKWKEIPPGGRFIIYACGAWLLVYLLRKRN